MFQPLRALCLAATVLAAGSAPALAAAVARAAAPPASATATPGPTVESLLRDAQAAGQRGDQTAAIQLYQSAIIFAPLDPGPYNALALLHGTSDQPELAEKYYGITLDLDPANPTALKGLALLELAAGNRASAEARHDILVRSCGQACPETIQVAQALMAGPAPAAIPN